MDGRARLRRVDAGIALDPMSPLGNVEEDESLDEIDPPIGIDGDDFDAVGQAGPSGGRSRRWRGK